MKVWWTTAQWCHTCLHISYTNSAVGDVSVRSHPTNNVFVQVSCQLAHAGANAAQPHPSPHPWHSWDWPTTTGNLINMRMPSPLQTKPYHDKKDTYFLFSKCTSGSLREERQLLINAHIKKNYNFSESTFNCQSHCTLAYIQNVDVVQGAS